MQKDIQCRLDYLRKENLKKNKFLVVVDFAGTLFALGPDKDHIRDPYLPRDAEYLSGKRAVKGAIELDPIGCKNRTLKPFQEGEDAQYAWTVIPSVARLLHDIKGVNVVASSVAGDAEQVLLQKQAYRDNHVRINQVMTKDDAKGIMGRGEYRPSTIVVLGDTSSDIDMAIEIARSASHAKVICGFTPSGMQENQEVQKVVHDIVELYPKAHKLCGFTLSDVPPQKNEPKEKIPENIRFYIGDKWSSVIRELARHLPIPKKSQYLNQFKKIRKRRSFINQNLYSLKKHTR